MFVGFNHVGIAVENVDSMVAILSAAFGAKEYDRREIPEAGQISSLVMIGKGEVEIMAPFGDKAGTVGKFLETHGPGLHHISLKTDDFDNDCASLEAQGIKVFGKTVMDGRKIAFAHPKSTGGILYEILE